MVFRISAGSVPRSEFSMVVVVVVVMLAVMVVVLMLKCGS